MRNVDYFSVILSCTVSCFYVCQLSITAVAVVLLTGQILIGMHESNLFLIYIRRELNLKHVVFK